LAADRTGEDHR